VPGVRNEARIGPLSQRGTSVWLRLAQDLIERTQVEMEQYFDDRSETWQESERGEEHQNCTGTVLAVLDAMSDLILI
jgi:hypothetical protein